MQARGWRLRFPIMVLLVVFVLAIRWFGPSADPTDDGKNASKVTESAAQDARVYFPPLLDMSYFYSGEGMEYATFTREITFISPNSLQIEDRSGTNLAQVVEVSPENLRIVWAEEEFYGNESLLADAAREDRTSGGVRNLILLQAPVVSGHSWQDEGFGREIIATDETVTVPLGTFYEVVAVKSRSLEADDFVTYEYYAKNMGLIKRVSVFESDEASYAIVSSLSSITGGFPHSF